MFSLLICRYNVCKDGIVFQRIEFATQETTSSNNGKTIGLTTAGNTKVSSRDLFREAVQKNGLGGTSEADAESQTENGIVSNKCQNGKMIDSIGDEFKQIGNSVANVGRTEKEKEAANSRR